MKKLIFFVVSLVFAITLAACNDGTTNYSKEVYEAAYDEPYNGNAKYEISVELVEGTEKINLDMLVDGYNIRTSDPYLPKYYDYVQLNNNKILGYYINDSFKDGSYYTDETYCMQIDEYNSAKEAKEFYVNALITAAVFPLSKEQYLEAYETKTIVCYEVVMNFEVVIDKDGHLKQILITPVNEEDGKSYLEINFTWNSNVSVSLADLADFHIHTDECIKYEVIDEYNHNVIKYGCDYAEIKNEHSESHKFDNNNKCIYCNYRKLTEEEKKRSI